VRALGSQGRSSAATPPASECTGEGGGGGGGGARPEVVRSAVELRARRVDPLGRARPAQDAPTSTAATAATACGRGGQWKSCVDAVAWMPRRQRALPSWRGDGRLLAQAAGLMGREAESGRRAGSTWSTGFRAAWDELAEPTSWTGLAVGCFAPGRREGETTRRAVFATLSFELSWSGFGAALREAARRSWGVR
jgi:hypothetical protein